MTQILNCFIHSHRGIFRSVVPLAATLSLSLCAGTAWGVKTSGSTYATKTGGPALTTDSDTHTMTHASSAASSSRSDAASAVLPNSHAQSWATAKIVGGVLSKTASGKTWFEAGNDSKAATWYSYASGTTLKVNSAAASVNVRLIIRNTADPLLIDPVDGPLDLPPLLSSNGEPMNSPMQDPHQQLYVDEVGSPNPDFLRFFVDLRSSVTQGATQQLINGSATVGVGTLDQSFHDDLNNVDLPIFSNPTIVNNRHTFNIDQDFGVTFPVLANQPFDLKTDLFMTLGYPQALQDLQNGLLPLIDPGQVTPATLGSTPPVGGGGSLIVLFEILDSGATLEIVPEPSSALLALMSVAGLAAFRRRKMVNPKS
jgi:MYXO-CTERM domain-containing protein